MEQIRELEKLKDKLSTIDNLIKLVEENNHYFNDIIDSKKELDKLAKETTALIERDREATNNNFANIARGNERIISDIKSLKNTSTDNIDIINHNNRLLHDKVDESNKFSKNSQGIITTELHEAKKIIIKNIDIIKNENRVSNEKIAQNNKVINQCYEKLTYQDTEIKQLKSELTQIKLLNEEMNKKNKANYIMIVTILSLTVLSIMLHFLF